MVNKFSDAKYSTSGICVASGMPDSAGRPQASSRLGFFGETTEPSLHIDNPMEDILRCWAIHVQICRHCYPESAVYKLGYTSSIFCLSSPEQSRTVREGTGILHREVRLLSHTNRCDHVLGATLVAIKLHD
jgi:hypothetical protein